MNTGLLYVHFFLVYSVSYFHNAASAELVSLQDIYSCIDMPLNLRYTVYSTLMLLRTNLDIA